MSETEKKSEVILIGGSKDGYTLDQEDGALQSLQNIVLNDELDGIEYVDLYERSGMLDRDGRVIYVATGRYNTEESQSFWDSLDRETVDQYIAEAKAEREEEAAKDAEEDKEKEEATSEESIEEKPKEETSEETKEEESEKVDEEK